MGMIIPSLCNMGGGAADTTDINESTTFSQYNSPFNIAPPPDGATAEMWQAYYAAVGSGSWQNQLPGSPYEDPIAKETHQNADRFADAWKKWISNAPTEAKAKDAWNKEPWYRRPVTWKPLFLQWWGRWYKDKPSPAQFDLTWDDVNRYYPTLPPEPPQPANL